MGENWNPNDYEPHNDSSYNSDSFDGEETWNEELDDHDQYLEQLVVQLRQTVEQGQTNARGELVDTLLNWVDVLAFHERSSEVVKTYKEVIRLCTELIDEGQFEYTETLGKVQLMHAVEIAELDPEGNYCAEYQKAISFLHESVYTGSLHCRSELAAAYMYLSDYQRARRFSINAAFFNAEQAIDIWRTLIEEGDLHQRSLLAAALVSKGVILREIGDCDATIAAFEESRTIQSILLNEEQEKDNEEQPHCEENEYEENDDPAIELLRCLILQAETLAHFQRFVQAHLLYDEAIAFYHSLEQTRADCVNGWLPILLVDKARIYRECWQFSAALKVYENAIEEYEKIRIRDLTVTSFLKMMISEVQKNRESEIGSPNSSYEEKEFRAESFDRMFRESTKDTARTRRCPDFIRENWDDYLDLQIGHIHSCRGCLFHDLGRFEISVSTFDEALEYYRTVEKRGKVDVELDICLVQLNRAKSLLAAKQPESAVEIQQEAVKHLQNLIQRGQTKLQANLAQALRELGASLDTLGNKESALEKIDASIALWREIIDEGKLENREQLAHSLLVRSDFLLEQKKLDDSLQGYLESYHIRNDLFLEGDWLVALPMVQTIFNLARNYYYLGDDQQALFWNIEALDILEKVRRRRLICVDAYILEGTRRCLGILLNIQNPDVVLKEIEKIFYFIEQIRNDEQSLAAIELMFPHFQMYKALAWRMKGCVAEEIQSLHQAIEAWEHLLKNEDADEVGEKQKRRIEYLTELGQSLIYLAEAYAEQGRTSPELQVHRKLKSVFDQLQGLGVEVSREKRAANLQRIARITREKV